MSTSTLSSVLLACASFDAVAVAFVPETGFKLAFAALLLVSYTLAWVGLGISAEKEAK